MVPARRRFQCRSEARTRHRCNATPTTAMDWGSAQPGRPPPAPANPRSGWSRLRVPLPPPALCRRVPESLHFAWRGQSASRPRQAALPLAAPRTTSGRSATTRRSPDRLADSDLGTTAFRRSPGSLRPVPRTRLGIRAEPMPPPRTPRPSPTRSRVAGRARDRRTARLAGFARSIHATRDPRPLGGTRAAQPSAPQRS